MAHAYWYNGTGNNKGKGLRRLTQPLGRLFDKILFSNVRLKLGGNLQFFIGGGALLDIELQKFFYALGIPMRSEEHTSELQSRPHLVCRLLLEKKKKKRN